MEHAKLYRRRLPVKAIQLTRQLSVESRTGVIETGHVGDYLVQGQQRPLDFWIVRREVFESEFEQTSGSSEKISLEA